MRRFGALALPALLATAGIMLPAAAAGAKVPLFPERWIDGTADAEPVTQVQALDADTYVIRQSIKTNFEAPFLYLLFGRDKALLVDTGAEGGIIRPTVDRLISEWLAAHKRTDIPLVVGHSHSHGDHVAGDAAFRERANTTVVGLKPADVAAAFGIRDWPKTIGRLDLGDRTLSIIPIPGHQAAAIAIYDPRLKLLLSGDTLYPGRLYVPVNFMGDERASVDRLVAFTRTHPFRAALGAHIEMTRTAGKDYAHEVVQHPDEHVLELGPAHLLELQKGLKTVSSVPDAAQVHDEFIIYPVAARSE